MKPAQSVTERYISNLLHNGRNKEFDIDMLVRRSSFAAPEEQVGYYFTAEVVATSDVKFQASGATPSQAVRRALEKHGVTFR